MIKWNKFFIEKIDEIKTSDILILTNQEEIFQACLRKIDAINGVLDEDGEKVFLTRHDYIKPKYVTHLA